ncbi:hypothetical protein HDU98_005056 [Podochytrium sp. JEL0797]|nr:hypothetical protein HDU98_005056 [Podochytrium sp. JEL0797]
MAPFEVDDCCCCNCPSEFVCCDDPFCEEPACNECSSEPLGSGSFTETSPVFSSSALKTLLFFGVAVSSAGAQAAGQSSFDPGNSTGDACASQTIPAYDVGFHIGAIFIIFAVSGTGIFTTLALGVHAKAPLFITVLQLFKMFGIGIICATAWIHLLPDAFSQFGNPCLPAAWQKYGTNYVGLFGMAAAFLVQFIELAAVGYKDRKMKRASKHHALENVVLDSSSKTLNEPTETQMCSDFAHVAVSGNASGFLTTDSIDTVVRVSDARKESSAGMTFLDAIPSAHSGKQPDHDHDSHEHTGITRDTELGTILLECGIIFHSLIIGVTLGVTADTTFTSLLIAVCFHQMFEGMALGVLIGNLNLSLQTKRLLCLAYPLTTPLGIAIGVGVRNVYNENDPNLILIQGIFNALSAGILFYNTYTELMSAEISHNAHFHGFNGNFKAACFLAMYLGAGTMALIGNWA